MGVRPTAAQLPMTITTFIHSDASAQAVAFGLITPQITIKKSTTTTSLLPGGTANFTITVTNTGAVSADGTLISDALPAGIAAFPSWTCTATGGAVCSAASGSGALSGQSITTFPVGGAVTYNITATAAGVVPSAVTNTATAIPPAGSTCIDGNSGNTVLPCSSSATISMLPLIEVQKTASVTALRANGTFTYNLVVSNIGAVAAPGTVISDPVPTGISAFTAWVCTPSGGAICPTASGTGAINQTVATFPAGATLTYTITAAVNAAPPATITNTASATPASGGCGTSNTLPPCIGTKTLPLAPVVSIQKSTASTTVTPNGTITYSIVVSNTSTVAADNAVVSDPLPTGIASATWTCAATGGGVCPNASGSGALNETIATFPAGAVLTYTMTATVSATPPAAVINTASVTPPAGGLCADNTAPPCTATSSVPPVPVVDLQKSTTTTAVSPGGTIAYTVTATNTSSVAANGTVISDPLPSGVASMTWVCTSTNGAACPAASGSGAINQTIATFPANSSVAYTITAVAVASPPASVTNLATATLPTGGLCAPANTPSPCTKSVIISSVPRVDISKSTTATALVPSGTLNYTITVSNIGTVAANNTVVSDPVPAGITGFTWTCAVSSGATACPNASGTGALNETISAFPAGAVLTYTITATVSATPPATVVNTATATPPTGGLCADNTTPPCSASSSVPPVPVVDLQKSTTTTSVSPGGTIAYTVTATNTSAVAANGTVVSDPLPSGVASATWTCATTNGAVCPAASGSGAINQTIATFPANSSVTYTIAATATASPPAAVTNTATATLPTGGLCAPGNTASPCTKTVIISSLPQVDVSKSTTTTTLVAGGTVNYTIIVSNIGTVAANNTVISDPLPSGLIAANWTCAVTSGAVVCPNAAGTGALNETLATFPAGSVLTYTVSATVSATPPANVVNTVTVTPPAGSLCGVGHTPPPCQSSVAIPSAAVVGIQKSSTSTTVSPNSSIVYTITVSNSGTIAANNTVVSDPLPTGLSAFSWTCAVATGAAVCPNAAGTGALNETIATFPGGSAVVYTVTATTGATLPNTVVNIATATPPSGGLCANGAPVPCTSSSSVPKAGSGAATSIPAVSLQGLLGLIVVLMGAGLLMRRRTQ